MHVVSEEKSAAEHNERLPAIAGHVWEALMKGIAKIVACRKDGRE